MARSMVRRKLTRQTLHLRLDRESPDGPTIKMVEELDAALEVPVPLFERVR